jgi:hypothetical protein
LSGPWLQKKERDHAKGTAMNKIDSRNLSRFILATSAAALAAVTITAAGFLGHGTSPAHASDRPGTPSNVTTMVNAGPLQAITVFWNNTAHESTCVEFSTTKDGQPVDLGAGCVRDSFLGAAPVEHEFDHLGAGSNYCFQLRARQGNNGDPQDGLVSEQWSAPVCATIPLPPPSPTLKTTSGVIASTSTLGSAESHVSVASSGSGFTPATSVFNDSPLWGSPTPVPTPIGPVHPR